MITTPVGRAAGAGKRRVTRLWHSLVLARRFYPSLQMPEVPRDSHVASGSAGGDDLFDLMVVRSLPRRLHALVRFRVAVRIGSAARAQQGALLCQAEGWSAEEVGAATIGYDWNGFSELERLVLRYTDDLTRTPMDVDVATLRHLKRLLTDDQMIELAASIAQENSRARFHTSIEAARSVSNPAA